MTDFNDDMLLDPREVDALIARAVAYCERAGIPPPSAERARTLVREWNALLLNAAHGEHSTPPLH